MEDLKQFLAENYLNQEKYPIANKDKNIVFPTSGCALNIKLYSKEDIEFILDIQNRKSSKILTIKKITFQNRAKKVYNLRRIDLGVKPHTNPKIDFEHPEPLINKYNGAKITEDHIHIYIEGFGDKWAVPLYEIEKFKDIENYNEYELLRNFIEYCNIKECSIHPSLEKYRNGEFN